MKRFIVYIALIISLAAPSHAMQEQQQPVHAYTIGRLLYKALSWIRRTDYLYLAYANEAWLLKNKISLHENISDLDKYYVRSGIKINNNYITPYQTPLHEAVAGGNLEIAAVLLAEGADKNKKISLHILPQALAQEAASLPCVHWEYTVNPDQFQSAIEKIHRENYIGLTAVELAERLMKESPEYKLDHRKRMYNLLKN